MNKCSPRVTVAVAAYNERRHLRGAIDSLLAQSFTDLEVIVVDDGSTDGTLDTLADIDDPRLRLHRQDNQGKAVALNYVLDHAKGEFICIQDADDEAGPDRIRSQVGAMDAHPDLGATFCRHELLINDEPRAPRQRGAGVEECAQLITRMRNPGHDPTIMFRREATAHIRFDPELYIGHGEDHLLRIGEEFPMMVVAGCHYRYRVHEGNMSKGSDTDVVRYTQEVRDRAAARRGIESVTVGNPDRMSRPEHMATVTYHVIASCVELVALGRRREAITNARRHLSGIWRYANSWLPLAYSLTPGPVLRRLRPDYAPMADHPHRYEFS